MQPRTFCLHVPTGRFVITDMTDEETGEIVIRSSEYIGPVMVEEWWTWHEPETVPVSELRPVRFDQIDDAAEIRRAVESA